MRGALVPEIGRRFFLKIASATGVAAACSPSHAPEKLVPLLNPPENMVPGKPLFYRTVCRGCGAGCGVTARSREGRVVKLEGNPDDPIGAGALCARGQAELQALYSPDRLRGPLARKGGELLPVTWADALAQLGALLGKLRGADGFVPGLRMLSRCEPGSAGAVQKAFVSALTPAAKARLVFEPRDLVSLRAANAQLFGRAELPVLDLSRARAVVSFGADFLETWLSPVEQARTFMAARSGPDRPRLTWVGPRLPMSGANADRWLRVRPGDELQVAIEVLRWLLDPANQVARLAPEAAVIRAALPPSRMPRDISSEQITHLGRELSARRPSALLGPAALSSGGGGTALAAAVQLTNFVLGNLGKTVLLGLGSEQDVPSTEEEVRGLLEEARRGEVKALFVHRADPLGRLPASARAEEALRKVPLIVAFGERLDATTRLANFVLPDHHALESFGDLEPRKGILDLLQPALSPLWDTRASSQALLDLAGALALPGMADRDFHELSKARWQAAAKALGAQLDSPQAQRDVQARGIVIGHVEAGSRPLRLERLSSLLRAPAPPGEGLQLVAFATTLANADPDAPGWLREVPDALSGVSWSSWAELSPTTAQRLGVKAGDLLALRTDEGAAELPAAINPALQEDAVAVPQDAPELRALGAIGRAVRVERTGKIFALPLTGHASQEGRDLARVVPRDGEPEHDHDHEHEHGDEGTLVPPHEHPKHRWAMSIDLDKCTGCQACVVACYAENNLPVVGPQAARDGRLMAWLRIQRSFESKVAPAETRIAILPSLCQHCDAAPCEPVCPVYATYHTPEGLNAQVYNRCIGTRYCANNCPYDVRVFNWADPVFVEPLQMQLNPDVSVRSKGVMEKCTFCVQRIRYAEGVARDEGREVRDGEVTPACVQTCPAQALVFGDAKDPKASVVSRQRDSRAYRLLEEVNTLPAIAYLARRGGEP
jgi:Fe-S-cluster-containing dehydrogenase component/anaerobic selenocysteine-containing dehydrogenase